MKEPPLRLSDVSGESGGTVDSSIGEDNPDAGDRALRLCIV